MYGTLLVEMTSTLESIKKDWPGVLTNSDARYFLGQVHVYRSMIEYVDGLGRKIALRKLSNEIADLILSKCED